MRRISLITTAAGLVTGLAASAQAQPELCRAVIASGAVNAMGGTGPKGGPLMIRGTFGQPVVGVSMSGSGPMVSSGFWPGLTGGVPGCNPADISDTPPGSGTFGQLDGNDISAFVAAFLANVPAADISDTPPGSGTFGQYDGNDISAFVAAFLAGCP